jgi:trehalose 6-phosphate phosphatase
MSLNAPPPLAADAALFLDFDGTLVPLAPRPQDVHVPARLPELLGVLHATLDGALAVISGRPIADLDGLLSPLRLPAAGLHGAEVRSGSGSMIESRYAVPPASLRGAAHALVDVHPGLLLEEKAAGFALHYRARPELEALCKATLRTALGETGDAATRWQLIDGHAVVELKQRGISKGSALRSLMESVPFSGRRPVYIGDDVTDEDGIAAAQDAGGIGVRVGPAATLALHRLPDSPAVIAWLEQGAASLVARVPSGNRPASYPSDEELS